VIKASSFLCEILAHMRIKIPWTNLSTEQTIIELEGVYVIVVPYLSKCFFCKIVYVYLYSVGVLTSIDSLSLFLSKIYNTLI